MARLKLHINGSGHFIHKETFNKKNLNKDIPEVITYQVSDAGVLRLRKAGVHNYGDSIHRTVFNRLWLFKEIYTKTTLDKLMKLSAAGETKRLERWIDEKISDVNVKNGVGLTALMLAAYNGHKETVELLIKKKADVNLEDNYGINALDWAVFNHKTEIVKLLRDQGAIYTPRKNITESAVATITKPLE